MNLVAGISIPLGIVILVSVLFIIIRVPNKKAIQFFQRKNWKQEVSAPMTCRDIYRNFTGQTRKIIWGNIFALIMCVLLAVALGGCGKQETVPQETESWEIESQETVLQDTELQETVSQEIVLQEIEESVLVSEETALEETSESPLNKEETAVAKPKTESASGDYFAAPSTSGKLHVEGTLLVDEKGNAVQLRGISTHGIGWFPDYINQNLFHEFRNDWGANVVRLAMYTAEGAGYCTGGNKENLKKLVTNGVDYATAEDLYVIIDWHILSDNNPKTYQSEAKTFFTEMAQKYADHNNVIYEICNEPNGGTDWPTIKSYAEDIIATIRTYDKDAIIIVGTPTWSQEVDKPAADPIKGYDNIMYTLHFYADTHKDGLRNTAKAALQSGLPLFVSEFGICDASGNGAINEGESKKWIEFLDSYGVSYVMWNLSNKNETSSVIASSCSKKSGFSQSDLSPAGKWLYQLLSGGGSTLVGNVPVNGNDENQNTADGNSKETSTESGASLPEAGTVKNGTSGSFSYTLIIENSWGDGSSVYSQCALTIKNNGEKADSWKVEIPFDQAISLDQGWCADFQVSGSSLIVGNADWNGVIESGSECSGIGFIIKE